MKSVLLALVAFLGLFIAVEVAAQSGLAALQYEQAESAFERGDLRSAVQNLNQAERYFGGVNAPILQLRILARHQMVRTNPSYDFNDLDALRTDCAAFTRQFANDARWIDYTREVRPVCQSLSGLPATREARDRAVRAERERREREEAAARQRQEQERQAALRTQRQEIDRRIAHHNARSNALEFWGAAKLVGGGLGVLTGGLVAMSELDGGPYSDETIGFVGLGVAILGAIGVWSGVDDLGSAGMHNRQAEELRRQRQALSVALTVQNPTDGIGVVATIRF